MCRLFAEISRRVCAHQFFRSTAGRFFPLDIQLELIYIAKKQMLSLGNFSKDKLLAMSQGWREMVVGRAGIGGEPRGLR